ncbi:hypothetical protein BNJ_00356 [Kaumoebavirus]|uniref:hypothetical protein n=1 Tax=Kaumoebavirus TaxID=1859492 RepID=UPI0009C2B28F|nr:hypothetical protein BNJ_00356 [Kaumoebavirus]ARA72176.1 hypothetical protein BNJ_00356 [Kaumoebavirus]
MDVPQLIAKIAFLLLIILIIAFIINQPTYSVYFLRGPDCPACDYVELQWISRAADMKKYGFSTYKLNTMVGSPLMTHHKVSALPAVVAYENSKIIFTASGSGDGTPDMVNEALQAIMDNRKVVVI